MAANSLQKWSGDVYKAAAKRGFGSTKKAYDPSVAAELKADIPSGGEALLSGLAGALAGTSAGGALAGGADPGNDSLSTIGKMIGGALGGLAGAAGMGSSRAAGANINRTIESIAAQAHLWEENVKRKTAADAVASMGEKFAQLNNPGNDPEAAVMNAKQKEMIVAQTLADLIDSGVAPDAALKVTQQVASIHDPRSMYGTVESQALETVAAFRTGQISDQEFAARMKALQFTQGVLNGDPRFNFGSASEALAPQATAALSMPELGTQMGGPSGYGLGMETGAPPMAPGPMGGPPPQGMAPQGQSSFPLDGYTENNFSMGGGMLSGDPGPMGVDPTGWLGVGPQQSGGVNPEGMLGIGQPGPETPEGKAQPGEVMDEPYDPADDFKQTSGLGADNRKSASDLLGKIGSGLKNAAKKLDSLVPGPGGMPEKLRHLGEGKNPNKGAAAGFAELAIGIDNPTELLPRGYPDMLEAQRTQADAAANVLYNIDQIAQKISDNPSLAEEVFGKGITHGEMGYRAVGNATGRGSAESYMQGAGINVGGFSIGGIGKGNPKASGLSQEEAEFVRSIEANIVDLNMSAARMGSPDAVQQAEYQRQVERNINFNTSLGENLAAITSVGEQARMLLERLNATPTKEGGGKRGGSSEPSWFEKEQYKHQIREQERQAAERRRQMSQAPQRKPGQYEW